MFPFFESIKLENGKFPLLDLHFERIKRSLLITYNDSRCLVKIIEALENNIFPAHGLYKLKISYGFEDFKLEFEPYTIKDHKKVCLIYADNIDYGLKFTERTSLDFDHQLFSDAIFVKNNNITDASYANLALFDGHTWFTPSLFLLAGVKRKDLITKGILKEKVITVQDLPSFEKIAFINAMRDFEKIYTFVYRKDFLDLKPFPNA